MEQDRFHYSADLMRQSLQVNIMVRSHFLPLCLFYLKIIFYYTIKKTAEVFSQTHIQKYFLKDFYNDHVKRYKKRPIYWLFASPKGSFNALIYMHRYRPDMVSIVFNDYLREFRMKLISRVDHRERIEAGVDVSQVEKTKALREIEKLKKIIKELEDYERDVLYPEGINVIAVFPDTGINIWGQKTLQSQPSAVDRINVRRLMMFMEEAISESSRFVVFEPNHPQTWRALGRLINPFLQDIKDKGGVYDFAFQCDEETNTPVVIDRNEMVARVFVKPTKTAEFIELNFILTNTGADFTEIF